MCISAAALGRHAGRLIALLTIAVLAGGQIPAACAQVVPPAVQPEAPSDPAEQAILGNWLTEMRDGIIQFSVTADGTLQGRIVGGDGPDRLDDKNPDPALRQRRLFGSIILRNMKYDGHGRWSGGKIYDPDTGHIYRCRLQLLGVDRLRVRGFLGVSMLGRSQIWTRYLGTSMQLPPSKPR